MQLYRLSGIEQRVAAAYGAGAYGSCDYNSSSTSCASSTANNSGGTALTNTGIAVVSIITIACLIALTAIVVRVWRRSAKKTVPELVTIDEEDRPSGSSQDDTPV